MNPQILLVDDDPNLLASLRRVLRRESFDIRTAESGEEALALLQTCSVDIVVSDNQMPGMCGTELLTKVRESHPEIIRIMLTGQATLDVAVKAINDGAITLFLTKPCDHHDLATMIRQAIRNRDLAEGARRLLATVKRQQAILDQLEKDSPGITSVNRDADGAVIIDDPPLDFEKFMSEIQSHTTK